MDALAVNNVIIAKMNLISETKKICKLNNIKPARSKGQNFLIKEGIYNKIIKASDLDKNDIVLEVGSGLGFLTTKLAEHVKQVVAVELDYKLVEILRDRLDEQGIMNVKIINQDILSSPTAPAGEVGLLENYKVVANLPYNITSRFLRKFLEEMKNKPSMMVLMVQKEVAERIIAKPGQMSLLAVSVQFYADTRIVGNAPKEAFWPKPKIDSAILKLQVTSNKYQEIDEKKFFKLVRAGFSSKRKQLQGNLVSSFAKASVDKKQLKLKPNEIKEILKENNLNEKVRAQELSVDDWKKIFLVMDRQNML